MESYVYIYFQELPADYALGDIEDDLDDLLAGVGEVTGAGLGNTGGNIDIEFSEESDALQTVISCLLSCGFDGETILDINGTRQKLSELDEKRYAK
ncbi:MAG: hypothetical protein K2G51_07065 [Lachnospiraceae bacterium]|nr:hypothetical protein [Lachnospiraceae bacterium]MDE7271821.1 hypothetical protein [Lachnospiraceae bacterium]